MHTGESKQSGLLTTQQITVVFLCMRRLSRPEEEPIHYMVRTQVPLSDYTLIGRSNDTVLRHAEVDESGSLATRPTNVFYAQRAT